MFCKSKLINISRRRHARRIITFIYSGDRSEVVCIISYIIHGWFLLLSSRFIKQKAGNKTFICMNDVCDSAGYLLRGAVPCWREHRRVKNAHRPNARHERARFCQRINNFSTRRYSLCQRNCRNFFVNHRSTLKNPIASRFHVCTALYIEVYQFSNFQRTRLGVRVARQSYEFTNHVDLLKWIEKNLAFSLARKKNCGRVDTKARYEELSPPGLITALVTCSVCACVRARARVWSAF